MTTSIPRPASAKVLRKTKTNITLGLVFVLLLSFTLYTLAFLGKKATRDVSIAAASNVNFDIRQTSTFSGRNSSPAEPELCSNVGKTTLFDTQPTLTGELYDELEWMDTLNYTVDYGEKTCHENKNGHPEKELFVEILHGWKSISRQYNIPYFLFYGSLIGAFRNADFIPWDHDMDIMVDKNYYDIIKCLGNKRNFTVDTKDPNFHLVVQKDFKPYYGHRSKRRRINCLGQVIYTTVFMLLCYDTINYIAEL